MLYKYLKEYNRKKPILSLKINSNKPINYPMTQKVSSTTLSNLQDSSMLKRREMLENGRKITLLFPPPEITQNSSLFPNTSGIYSDGKTESIFKGNICDESAVKSCENKVFGILKKKIKALFLVS